MDDYKKFDLSRASEFDWDKGNTNKNRLRHDVGTNECEEVFFNQPKVIFDDTLHSTDQEKRYRVLGITNTGRRLALAITIRGSKLRVIMARDQSRKERQLYEQEVTKRRKGEKL